MKVHNSSIYRVNSSCSFKLAVENGFELVIELVVGLFIFLFSLISCWKR